MRFVIEKRVTFEAAHSLPSMPEGHQCRRLHGHSYKVDVVLASAALDEDGMVVDFGKISDAIKSTFDHQNLNDVLKAAAAIGEDPMPSTAEVMCQAIATLIDRAVLAPLNHDEPEASWVKLLRITVRETETSAATLEFEAAPCG